MLVIAIIIITLCGLLVPALTVSFFVRNFSHSERARHAAGILRRFLLSVFAIVAVTGIGFVFEFGFCGIKTYCQYTGMTYAMALISTIVVLIVNVMQATRSSPHDHQN